MNYIPSLGGSDLTVLASSTYWETYETLYGFELSCKLREKQGLVALDTIGLFHPISTLACYAQRYQCTEPRDKLFGFLSFLLELLRALLPPKYEQSIESLNLKYTAAALLVSGSAILYCILPAEGCSGNTYPSWVFDFFSTGCQWKISSFHALDP